jgi:mono/diheme cytochrome c family protein
MFSRFAPLAVIALCACDVTPPREAAQPTAQDTMQLAAASYDPAVFDTIGWPSDSAAHARGADVFKWDCATCHGPAGQGDAGFINERGDTLRPPSFVQPGWRFAGDLMGLRRQVFVGNTQGMPHWGLRRMQARDIDAVARYIENVLRAPPALR